MLLLHCSTATSVVGGHLVARPRTRRAARASAPHGVCAGASPGDRPRHYACTGASPVDRLGAAAYACASYGGCAGALPGDQRGVAAFASTSHGGRFGAAACANANATGIVSARSSNRVITVFLS